MEQVLIWPKEYPLLVKGLVEQNGAFILDALESWPRCGSNVDEQGVIATVLPPLYYLHWLKPLEPFEACYFQHIAEFDEPAQHYLSQLSAHFNAIELAQESQVLSLLEPLAGYSDIAAQATVDTSLSLFKLLYDKRYFGVISFCLDHGATLCSEDVMVLWQEPEFREKLATYIPGQIRDIDTLQQKLIAALSQGEDYYTLMALISEDDITDYLESALLAHLNSEHALQSMALRFIEQGAQGVKPNDKGEQAIHLAAQKGFLAVVEKLFARTGNATDGLGQLATHHAVIGNSLPVLKRLLELGTEPKALSKAGLTVYGLALELRRTNILKVLDKELHLKELSKDEQYNEIRLVHGLLGLCASLLPIELFFFFDEAFEYKTELTLGLFLVSLVSLFSAVTLKRRDCYPLGIQPWSLTLLGVFAWISVIALSCICAITVLTLIQY